MPKFLRKLANKAHFFRQEWLEKDDAPADAFASFLTKDSTLSVWAIDEDESNLGRIAASRDSITSVPHFQDHASDNWGPEGAGSDGVVNRSWSGRRSNMLSWSTCSIW